MKKLFSILLALAIVLSLAIPAFAATGAGTITVSNTTKGHTYTVYKLFDLDFDDKNTTDTKDDLYNWTIAKDSPWVSFLQNNATAKQFITISLPEGAAAYNVAPKGSGFTTATAQGLARAALAWAKDYEKNHGQSGHNCIVIAQETAGADDELISFKDPTSGVSKTFDWGYYLVDSTVGASGMLYPLNTNLPIADKNNPPVIEKEVKEVQGNATVGTWDDENDSFYGKPIDFKLEFKKQAGAEKYAVHDYMDDYLELDKTSIKVERMNDDGTVGPTLTAGTMDNNGYLTSGQYAVRYHGETKFPCDVTVNDPDGEGECTFEVRFDNDYMAGVADNTTFRISYQASLKPDAPVATAIPNGTTITYGDRGITTYDYTETFTWPVRLFKYAITPTDSEAPLAGATFELLTMDTDTPFKLVSLGMKETTTSDGKMQVPHYRVATDADTNTVTKITTDKTGRVVINGLDSGTFYVRETDAPAGYNKLTERVVVRITNTGEVLFLSESEYKAKTETQLADPANWSKVNANAVFILNQTGATLPSTGGMGTTVLYITGSILMLGAAVLLITKRRMSTN